MEACAEACKAVDCKQLLTLTGNDVPGMTREAMMESAIAGLKEVAPMLEAKGLVATIEVLNIHRDHKGYFFHYIRDGIKMVEGVGSPSIKLLFDLYHIQIMEGNLIENLRKNIKYVSHFHIGDVPGRHQPGTGEVNYRNVYKAIADLKEYTGTAALEYGPTIPVLEDLANQRKMSMFP
jgi:hydroxypyruvate isomerase